MTVRTIKTKPKFQNTACECATYGTHQWAVVGSACVCLCVFTVSVFSTIRANSPMNASGASALIQTRCELCRNRKHTHGPIHALQTRTGTSPLIKLDL